MVLVNIGWAQEGARVKDVASVTGLEDVQVFGYGLVVGLAGTGDRSHTVFTTQAIKNMLKSMGMELPDRQMNVKNVAAVIVTGTLVPFKKAGTRFDITVSSMGDAKSLEGGTLLMTPLQGPDGKVYASAQGPLSTGGYDIRNKGLARVKKNHVVVGRIPDGAIVQREYHFNNLGKMDLSLSLYYPDFSSAVSLANAVNAVFNLQNNERGAVALDAATVRLDFGRIRTNAQFQNLSMPEFISQVENIRFRVSQEARVVMNERTGTIVAGGNVRISEVAVTHGGVKVEIVNVAEAVQPVPFTLGQTEIIPNPEMVVEEKDMEMVVLDETTTVADLAQALNSLGVAPRDIISIFQAIKISGALQAKLIVM